MVGVRKVDNLEFKWGRQKAIGSRNKNVHFYESFSFDGEEYWLYDSVYIFKDGVSYPYIGKIIKIWECADKSKNVKILWFFYPFEISRFLGTEGAAENELFLASGEGKGLANANPLEAIAGKCIVICTSKDSRNPQPSGDVIKMADFVFHRTFDVGKLIILDKVDENIAGLEVKNIFNQLRFLEPSLTLKPAQNGNDAVANAIVFLLEPNSIDVGEDSGGPDGRPNKKPKLENARVGTTFDKIDSSLKVQKISNDTNANHARVLPPDATGFEQRPKLKKDPGGTVNSRFKTQKVNDKLIKPNADGKLPKISSTKPPKDNKKTGDGVVKVTTRPDDVTKPTAKGKLHKMSSKWSPKDDQKTDKQVFEVTPRPDDDRSKWFVEPNWEERIKNAHDRGMLILLQNLDPSYTSAEVADIVWHAFNERCSAKTIQQTAFLSPHTGQALVVMDTQEAAEKVFKKLKERCLLLPNGRPVVASFPDPCFSRKQATFVGHLVLDKIKFQWHQGMKEAVSTSHCSQPNSIEYDMAMEWCLLQERSDLALKKLFEQQEQEFGKLKTNLKSK